MCPLLHELEFMETQTAIDIISTINALFLIIHYILQNNLCFSDVLHTYLITQKSGATKIVKLNVL